MIPFSCSLRALYLFESVTRVDYRYNPVSFLCKAVRYYTVLCCFSPVALQKVFKQNQNIGTVLFPV